MKTDNSIERTGIGVRAVALAIDSLVWFVLLFAAVYLVGAATGQLEINGNHVNASLEGVPGAVALLLWLGFGIGYHTLLEWRFGKTIGKYLVGIRVMNKDGTRASFRSALIRNLFRLVDWLPMFYLVGIITYFLSGEHTRIGDKIGSTVVVRT